MRVLIAEDDPVSALALEASLEQQGYTVTTATNGAQAWRLFQETIFPIVILDWMMPEMDGLEVCRRIRKRTDGPYTCVIMLTAKQGREDRLQALSAGVDVFLSKPLDTEDMYARLQIANRILALECK